MRFVAVLIASALLVGCAEPDDPSFDIDPAFPVEAQLAIVKGMHWWDPFVHPHMRPSLDRPGTWRIEMGDPGGGVMGRVKRSWRVVIIHPKADPELTMAHETGHVLGLNHVPDGTGVMSKDGALPEITQVDVAECRKAGSCP